MLTWPRAQLQCHPGAERVTHHMGIIQVERSHDSL